jgi:hypothetical protein
MAVLSLIGLAAGLGLGHLFAPRIGLAGYFIFAGLGAFSAFCLYSPGSWRSRRQWIIPAILVAVLSIWFGPQINAALDATGIVLVDLALLALFVAAISVVQRNRNPGSIPRP